MENQCLRILAYMKRYGSITNKECCDNLHIYRFSGRIYEIEHDMKIELDRVTEYGKDEFGTPKHWTRYSIRKSDPKATL